VHALSEIKDALTLGFVESGTVDIHGIYLSSKIRILSWLTRGSIILWIQRGCR